MPLSPQPGRLVVPRSRIRLTTLETRRPSRHPPPNLDGGSPFRAERLTEVRPSAANSGTTKNPIGDFGPPREPESAPVRSLCRGPDASPPLTRGHYGRIPAVTGTLVLYLYINELSGGGSGIRTHETLASLHAFQACAFNHSAIPPQDVWNGAHYSHVRGPRNTP